MKMPNQCNCDLIITGDDKWLDKVEFFVSELKEPTPEHKKYAQDVLRLAKENRSLSEIASALNIHEEMVREIYLDEEFHNDLRNFSFNKIAPQPEWDAIELPWGDWRQEYWGTERPAREVDKERAQNRLQYRFWTAWSPPVPVIRTLAPLFPSVCFDLMYYDYDMLFAGNQILKGGKIIVDEHTRFSGDKETVFGLPKLNPDQEKEREHWQFVGARIEETAGREDPATFAHQLILAGYGLGWRPTSVETFVQNRFGIEWNELGEKMTLEQFRAAQKYFEERKGLITYHSCIGVGCMKCPPESVAV
jgi:hypothetical protein